MKEHDFQMLSILGKNSSIKNGCLTAASDVNISGLLELNIEGDQKVSVTETGYIKGNITAANIIISGKVDGDIYAKNSLILRSTAEIEGSVYAPSLAIEEGAYGNFDCSMSSIPLSKVPSLADDTLNSYKKTKKPVEEYTNGDVPHNSKNGTSNSSGYW